MERRKLRLEFSVSGYTRAAAPKLNAPESKLLKTPLSPPENHVVDGQRARLNVLVVRCTHAFHSFGFRLPFAYRKPSVSRLEEEDEKRKNCQVINDQLKTVWVNPALPSKNPSSRECAGVHC